MNGKKKKERKKETNKQTNKQTKQTKNRKCTKIDANGNVKKQWDLITAKHTYITWCMTHNINNLHIAINVYIHIYVCVWGCVCVEIGEKVKKRICYIEIDFHI